MLKAVRKSWKYQVSLTSRRKDNRQYTSCDNWEKTDGRVDGFMAIAITVPHKRLSGAIQLETDSREFPFLQYCLQA
ncbi:hypothetical protein GMOD_00003904 [Pyrenophora seminiperda CCB06]|uniref:Uncharacterized protein n=1 Tax=Pyrenophora seminiperda CCB06 TaxID=1302712 RepID=A0A3M7M076_9PLEO|nr:hypothetical protein GMOD_00003904 [Pyrenophora seminiperda CCB06]